MPRKPTLFRVIGARETSGLRRRLRALLPRLVDDFAVHLVVCGGAEAPFERLPELGVRVHSLPGAVPCNPAAARSLAGLFVRHGADLVHSNGAEGNVRGMLAARLAGVPVRIAQVHDDGEASAGGAAIIRQARKVQELAVLGFCAHHVLAATTRTKEVWAEKSRFLRDRLAVLHDGLDLSELSAAPDNSGQVCREYGLKADQTVLGYVSKPEDDHNLDFVLAFMGRLAAERPDCRLLVAGPSGSRRLQTLHNSAESFGCRSQTIFTGWFDNIADFYRSCGLLLFAAADEQKRLPGVILEACALGLPILSRRHRTVAEIAGYYPRIHFMDDDESPPGAVEATLALPPDSGEIFLRHFSMEAMALRTKKLYDQLLVNKGKLL